MWPSHGGALARRPRLFLEVTTSIQAASHICLSSIAGPAGAPKGALRLGLGLGSVRGVLRRRTAREKKEEHRAKRFPYGSVAALPEGACTFRPPAFAVVDSGLYGAVPQRKPLRPFFLKTLCSHHHNYDGGDRVAKPPYLNFIETYLNGLNSLDDGDSGDFGDFGDFDWRF